MRNTAGSRVCPSSHISQKKAGIAPAPRGKIGETCEKRKYFLNFEKPLCKMKGICYNTVR